MLLDSNRWTRSRPPVGVAVPARSSWLFVPLLYAGSAQMDAETERALGGVAGAGERWSLLARTLREAPPVDPERLAVLLHALAVLDEDAEAAVRK